MTHTFLAGRHGAALRLALAVLLAAVLVLALGPAPASATPKWIREFVSKTFGPIDMTMGPDGKLLVAYVDETSFSEHDGELRFAVRDGSDWTTTTVAPASYCPHLDGVNLSLAYNANANLAAISFYDHCEAIYRVAIGVNPVGNVWVWTLEEPPNWYQGEWGWEFFGSDIAIDDQGKIHLVTIDDFKIYYLWRTEDDGWETTGIPLRREDAGMVQDVSLTLGPDGKPYVVWDTAPSDTNGINYAYPSILNTFTIEHVTTDHSTGLGHSLVIDSSGVPSIAFYAQNRLNYARRTDTDTWEISIVDPGVICAAGQFPSLALDAAGNPHISYHCRADTSHGSVRYAHWDGAAWQIEHASPYYLDNEWTALVLDEADVPHILYTYYNDLSYATRTEVPPEAYIDTRPPLNDPLTTATFTFHSNDTAATFECRLDSAAVAACASPHSYSGLADGSHTFQVRATDAGGLTSLNPAEYTWAVDTFAPSTTLTSTPPNPSAGKSAAFAFSSNETGATFECKLDSAAFSGCGSPKGYNNLTDGSHTFEVRAKDAAGNVDPTPPSYTWTIDTVVPNTTIDAYPSNPSTSASATFAFSSNEAGAMFACKLDSGDYADCTSPKSYNNLTDGSHTFTVRAGDAAGNLDPSPASYTWTIDTAPETTITTKPSNPSNDPTPDFAFTSSDGGSADGILFHCQTDANGWFPCGGDSITYHNLFDGDHTFYVKAEDTMGNVDPTPATWSLTMDLTAPETTITVKPAAATKSTNATFQFTSEAGATFECKLDSGNFAACTSPQSYTGLSEASHTFQVRAGDAVGNVGSPAGYTWIIDTTPPETTITAHPDALTTSATATFSFTGVGAASFECKLDSGGFVACTSPITYTGLYNGSHTFHVWAIDAAGNYDTSTANYTWTVDTNPPETSITGKPAATTNSTTAEFTFTSVDGAASFECKLDTAAFAVCTSPISYTGLGNGSHTFAVRAKDAAGNYDPSPATVTWSIDTAAPDTTLTQTPPNPSTSSSATLAFSSETGATFECKLDTAAYAVCTSPKSYTGLTDGSHTFDVRAKDAAGNVDPSPATVTWIVDTTPPTTTIAFTDVLPGSIHFTVNFTEPVDGFANNDVALSGTAGATTAVVTNLQDRMAFDLAVSGMTGDGTIILAIAAGAATDAAGNGNTAATLTWTIDTTGPAVTITAAPPDPSGSAEAVFTFSSDDATATIACSLDGANFAACASPKSYSGLSDGRHTFLAWATDAAGNSGDPAGHSWTVDTTPPDTSIDTWIGDVFTVNTITIEFSSNEAGSTFECQLDSGSWTECTSPITYDDLADGPHTFQVRATDPAGNTDLSPAGEDWTVQTPGPDTSLDSYPPNPSNSPTATFTFSGSGAASFECSLDDAPFAECASPHQVTDLADGSHFFAVRAVDDQGKADTDYPIHFWTVDATPPTTTIAFTDVLPGSIHFTVNFTEPVNGFANDDVALSGTAGATTAVITNLHDRMAFDLAVSGMTGDGTIILAIAAGAATDAAGNGNTAATLTWTNDTTGPAVTITAAPPDPSNSAEAVFTFSSDDATATIACSLDGADFTACASPKSYSGLSDGRHTFLAWATDAAGNSGDPAGHTWTVDTTPPDTTITAQPPALATSPTAEFRFSSEAGATFECRLDGGEFAACASPKSYTGLSEGPHTFAAQAKDAAGNTDPSPATVTWTVDTTAPDTTIDSGPTGTTGDNNAVFAFSSEPGATFHCRLDGDAATTCASPQSYPDLADGPHTFSVYACDVAGNCAATPVTRTWTIDTAGPGATIDAAPGSPANDNTPTFAFSGNDGAIAFQCRTDSGDYTACVSPITLGPLADGEHTFDVRGIDGAGNLGAPDSHTWTIDTVAPTATITTAPPNPSDSGAATFTFNSSESGATFTCQLDEAPWTPCTGQVTYTGLSQGSHTFRVQATDAAGNVGDIVTYNWTITFPPPDVNLFVSTNAAGVVAGLTYGPEDVLRWNGSVWTRWFDGSAAGLTPTGKAQHNIHAIWIPDPAEDDLVMSFGQNRRHVPGIAQPVDGMDLVWWDGAHFTFWFDGSDVELTDMTQEKIDGLHVLPGNLSPINGGNCLYYLLISTQGPGKVKGHDNAFFKFGGEDVLGFCATSLGVNTAGKWHLVLDGSAQGLPKNALTSLSAGGDGRTLYLTTKCAINVDGATGGQSMIFAYDMTSQTFRGPLFNAPATGLSRQVDGLEVVSLPE